MADYGMLIDYDWCTGCHTCETACQMEHNLPPDQFGIKVTEVGPYQYGDRKWVLINMPIPTDQCNFCVERIAQGKLPTCMHHCQARCLEVGLIDELQSKLSAKKKQVLFHNQG
ncbi:4Fe-4S binding protein [Adlercreutzia sp. ZJ154]|uniref:4Fe-4S binding protein n=1 Tax=Adlercreutzia sp. ZJ154 TaxID=2709790 RepID=UPI0013EADBD9|nr:4Fe-4S binding protein [Adlercreutzia sp. ZJ154]